MYRPRIIFVIVTLLLVVVFQQILHANAPMALIKDISPGIDRQPNWFNPALASQFASAGEATYFAASYPSDSFMYGLWKTDGTDAGTDAIALSASSLQPHSLTSLGSQLLFINYDSQSGYELWRSDGTSLGTSLVTDIWPGSGSGNPRSLTRLADSLLFVASTAQGVGLWRTDGTSAGTVQLKNFGQITSGGPGRFISAGTLVYFTLDAFPAATLWRSDGTVAGTYALANPAYVAASDLSVLDGSLFFRSQDDRIWRSDGTAAGTVPVIAAADFGRQSLRSLTSVDGRIFFTAVYSPSNAIELWQTNGSQQDTSRVTDFAPDQGAAQPYALTAFGSRLLFGLSKANSEPQLWISDGSEAGTTLLKDIAPFTQGSGGLYLVVLDSVALFYATTPANGHELWRTDGTAAGTRLVKDINPGSASSILSPASYLRLHAHAGKVYFPATDGAHGLELWVSDGSEAGTAMIERRVDLKGSQPRDFVNVDNLVFFHAYAPEGYGLWVSDGTPDGTIALPNAHIYSSQVRSIAFKQNLFMMLTSANYSVWELWRSDGTPSGTVMVKQFTPDYTVLPRPFVVLDDVLYFSVRHQLWRSDGTPAGTVMVAQMNDGQIDGLTAVNGRLFFVFKDYVCSSECSQAWTSDGTASGTFKLKGFDSSPLRIVDGGPYAYIAQRSYDYRNEIWRTDGTVANTIRLVDLDPAIINLDGFTRVGARLYWHGFSLDANRRDELWVSDGSVAGTSKVKTFFTAAAAPEAAALGGRLVFKAADQLWATSGTPTETVLLGTVNVDGPLSLLGDHVYFRGDDGAVGAELWRTDGTPGGTALVKDIAAGPRGSMSFSVLQPISNGRAVFYADDGVHGFEPWQTDGTTAGTFLIQDLYPGFVGSNIYVPSFGSTPNQLILSANDGVAGDELWAIPYALSPLPTPTAVTSTVVAATATASVATPTPPAATPTAVGPLPSHQVYLPALIR